MAPEAGGSQETLMLVGPSGSAVRLVGGLAPATMVVKVKHVLHAPAHYVPTTIRLLFDEDLVLETLHSYHPTSLPVTASVWL